MVVRCRKCRQLLTRRNGRWVTVVGGHAMCAKDARDHTPVED
jgi:hypothetical protein